MTDVSFSEPPASRTAPSAAVGPFPAPELDPRIRWSVFIRRVDPFPAAGVLYEHDSGTSLETASIGKLFLLAEIARQAVSGELDLGEVVSRDDESPEDPMEDSGLLYLLRQRGLCIADLCILVGGFSDNYATNLLVGRVGLGAVTRCSRDVLGYRSSALLDKVRWTRDASMPDDMSRGCAGELCDYMARMHAGTLIGPRESAMVERWLGADADTSMVSGVFNVDPLAHWPDDAGFALRHKTGTESDVRCDVGVVSSRSTGATIAYAVLANWDRGTGDLRDVVIADMRRIGGTIRDALDAPSSAAPAVGEKGD